MKMNILHIPAVAAAALLGAAVATLNLWLLSGGFFALMRGYASGERTAAVRALLAFGGEPIGAPPWTAAALFRPIPGAGPYQDSTVRRFRYVAVAGLPGVFSAEVLATRPESWPALAPHTIGRWR